MRDQQVCRTAALDEDGRVTSPNIVGVLVRIYVDDVAEALPLYQKLANGAEPHRFTYRDMALAAVGPFLLIQGADEEVRTHAGTLAVRDVQAVADAVRSAGGELLEGPAPGPNGPRLIARHPDGTVLEYIQLG